ncbi:alpha/beta hydrolase [Alteromonas sp. H39]|uniref:alpha/beta hydrolase n=1 Tax=Alteromonas sp. H39 TaxID=3389876 RepID=UPI0039DF30D0
MTIKVWIIASGLCLLLWAGYTYRTDIGLWGINSAVLLSTDASITRDIAFGDAPWQKLDIYAQPRPAPVVVFIYGGGWSSGKKSEYAFAADAFYRKGYTVVIPDYAKYPNATYPTFVEDVTAAIAWTFENITGDKYPLYLAAHSAGAHSAALVAIDNHYLQAHGLTPSVISAFAGLAGPYNFTPEDPQYVRTFGKENFTDMKANTHVRGDEPPSLLLHAKGDDLVAMKNATSYQQALQQHDVPVETVFYPESMSHTDMVLSLHPWFAKDHAMLQTIHRFFTAYSATTNSNPPAPHTE